jgi:hypothetical protein
MLFSRVWACSVSWSGRMPLMTGIPDVVVVFWIVYLPIWSVAR